MLDSRLRGNDREMGGNNGGGAGMTEKKMGEKDNDYFFLAQRIHSRIAISFFLGRNFLLREGRVF